jgi:signal peptidase I
MTNKKMNKKNNIINLKTEEKEGKKKKILKGTIEWIIYVLIFVAIVWGTPKALTKILNTSYPIASITSSSMWPALKQGDIVLIKGVSNKKEIALGDIVVYTNEKGFTIHRVIKLNDETLVTKGDANNVEDKPVAYDQLIGKAVKWRDKVVRIPYLGRLSQIFQ